MIRKIIEIDQEKCNGCGACANACHEGAIQMVNGKAHLMRDDYCDGFGDCLPVCPTNAISFTEREAAEYNEAAVLENKRKAKTGEPIKNYGAAHTHGEHHHGMHAEGGCPGHKMRMFDRNECENAPKSNAPRMSQLRQWPCQIKLAAPNMEFFDGAKLLIAADCTAYAYASMHEEFMKGKITLIGCPKLDATDYTEKLTEIIRNNDIKSVTVARMEVPCCKGIEDAAKNALMASGKFIPWQVVTISVDGKILDR
ncbi:MAG: 4Fe-4S binding protein [Clostridia bacterium]|nr:4Fe-4S binding protein [Clostridia bacterium]